MRFLARVAAGCYFGSKVSTYLRPLGLTKNGTGKVFGKLYARGVSRFAVRHTRNGARNRGRDTARTAPYSTFHRWYCYHCMAERNFFIAFTSSWRIRSAETE